MVNTSYVGICVEFWWKQPSGL